MTVLRTIDEVDELPVGSRLQYDYESEGLFAEFEKLESGLWRTTRDDALPFAVGWEEPRPVSQETLDDGVVSLIAA